MSEKTLGGWTGSGVIIPAYDYSRLMTDTSRFLRDGGHVMTVYLKYSDGRMQSNERLNVAFAWSGSGEPDPKFLKGVIQEAIIAAPSLSRAEKIAISDSSLLDVVLWTEAEVRAYVHGKGPHSVRFLLCPDGSFVAPEVKPGYAGSNVQKLSQNNPSMLAVLMNYFNGEGDNIAGVERMLNALPPDELFRFYLLALGVTVDSQSIADALDTSRALQIKGECRTYHAKTQVDHLTGQLIVIPLGLDAEALFRDHHLIGADVLLQLNKTERSNEQQTKPKQSITFDAYPNITTRVAKELSQIAKNESDEHIVTGQLITVEKLREFQEAVEQSRKKAEENLKRGKRGKQP